jgi:ribonuclease BN (tRNA processing enzyme)
LGTAGGSIAVNRQLRSSGGIVLRIRGIQFHLDPGPGALIKAKDYGVNLRANNVLLCSHNHLSHCNDVNIIIDHMTHSGIDNLGILIGSKSVIQGKENERPYVTRKHRKRVEKALALEAGNVVKFGNNIELKSLKTKHSDETALGFKLFCDKFVVGYSGDTAYFDGLIDELKGSDILILNVLRPFGYKDENNLSSDDAVKIIKEVKPNLAIITHFGQKMLEQNPIYQARDIQRVTDVQTIAARDGITINPNTYSVSLKHKNLNLY